MTIMIISIVLIVIPSTFKMCLLTKLNSILTQQPPLEKQLLLKQILLLLKNEIILGQLSKIWITFNNKDNFITIYNYRDIQVNLRKKEGKDLLTCIISFIIDRLNNNDIFLFILKNENINVRKILATHNKNIFRNEEKLFTYMMRSFVIVNQQVYKDIFSQPNNYDNNYSNK